MSSDTEGVNVMSEHKVFALKGVRMASARVAHLKDRLLMWEYELTRACEIASNREASLREIAECTHLHHTTISKRLRAYRKGE